MPTRTRRGKNLFFSFTETIRMRPREAWRVHAATTNLLGYHARFTYSWTAGEASRYESSSDSSGIFSRIDSSSSPTGAGITYAPLAHLPRSIVRQRSLQKGNSASPLLTTFLQIGQRSLSERLRGIGE